MQLQALLATLLVCGEAGRVKRPAKQLEDQTYWNEVAREELNIALNVKLNTNLAKNVILFVGDGMCPNTLTAARIYKQSESARLSFENFPHMGLLKTYNADRMVPDSASTATALFSGVKTNFKVVGVDQHVNYTDCAASLDKTRWLHSVLKWAQDAGKDTGFVTTTRVTHATPSALYAHTASRDWECESKMPASASHCKDIARQLVEDEPGKNIKVIMGGGYQTLVSNASTLPGDPIDTWACYRQDGRNLIEDWKLDKISRNATYSVLRNVTDLRNLDISETDYVLGIFANGHMNYDDLHVSAGSSMPSLHEMTTTAIRVLQKNQKGYVLVVEGGLIDVAHHRGYARRALQETLALDTAVEETLNTIKYDPLKLKTNEALSDTLVIVTSDHTHSLSINGYPARGSNILGIAKKSVVDNIPYTILTYSTGSNLAFNYTVVNGTEIIRDNPENYDYTSFDYHQQAAILTDEASHGGGDVTVYAAGPMAHLFHTSHEQHYVAHVMGYAARIGPYADIPHNRGVSNLKLNAALMVVTYLIQSRFCLMLINCNSE
ncbi:alkaline phosphatase-like isoform X1 [Schistocerca americana]|uniref:alkaline phosphatase-like n=1 Tax=Schistocerca serialis cubense TaxID=2023355 RepID=UPI001F4FF575|nr:alkaline phosphatase-like isoform X1 [Schistocerca americana]XP_049952855.1 alkaline phosphatase-like [Schistocerca serialis cubense]